MNNNWVMVTGAGGFIGGHLVKHLLALDYNVVCVDIKPKEEWWQVPKTLHAWIVDSHDLRSDSTCRRLVSRFKPVEIYNLAADMGGMGFIENNKIACMHNVLINTNLISAAHKYGCERYFFASSACVYPDYRQQTTTCTALKETDAYPAMPEDGYGWEKLFSERLCIHYQEETNMVVRVARFHNVYGPYGSWTGGREKAPAAICRKVAETSEGGTIEIWGDGLQTRSFMYIDDCIRGIMKIMKSDIDRPVNLGSSELVSINDLFEVVCSVADKFFHVRHKLNAPLGVRGRNSDNSFIKEALGWEPNIPLKKGIEETYAWIKQRVETHS